MPSNFPLGLVIGIVCLGLVAAVMWWAFAALPEQQKRRAAQRRVNENCIIVPLNGSADSKQALDFACALAVERHGRIILAHVIEIPLTLGLDVPLEEAEKDGERILAEGAAMVQEFRLPVECRLIRHRKTSLAIFELAEETGAETIVLGAGTRHWWSVDHLGRTAADLESRALCQVLFAKAPVAA